MTPHDNARAAEMTAAMQKAVTDLAEIAENQKTLIDIYVETTRLLQGMMETQHQALARLADGSL
ncbi:hypothetical protein [Rhizobium straminoryzae]|uniref:Uncharacterized protein n=1 Tax=Rhizobium straminoryzae TaxID=1387186 RepID=A0A549TID0_9HYPH|nr:hypothetical protein [Rhizobium straminoryzae]TRL43000.1 hypothetical protein FNA46_00885 [Rhizobium straminoryzae]